MNRLSNFIYSMRIASEDWFVDETPLLIARGPSRYIDGILHDYYRLTIKIERQRI